MTHPIPNPAEFYKAIRALKRLDPRHQDLASYIAKWWSDDRLMEAERTGDLPGQPGTLNPEKASLQ